MYVLGNAKALKYIIAAGVAINRSGGLPIVAPITTGLRRLLTRLFSIISLLLYDDELDKSIDRGAIGRAIEKGYKQKPTK